MERSVRTSGVPARRGPRGARGVVRAEIIEAAGGVFAASGWGGTTMSAVAEAAGVDTRTVGYYFADKEALLDAALEPPDGFLTGVQRLNGVPLPERGRALVRSLLRWWSRPANAKLLALIIAIGQQHPAGLANLEEIFRVRTVGVIADGLEGDDAELRAGLVGGHLVSVAVSRFVWRLEPLASLSDAAVVAIVSPAVQHLLDGDLGLAAGRRRQASA